MRVTVKYKSAWIAIFIAVVFITLYIGHYLLYNATPSYSATQLMERYAQWSLVGRGLMQLQIAYPKLNAALCVVVILIGGLLTNKFTIQNNLYGEATKMPFVIYTLACVSYLDAPIIIMPAIAALLIIIALMALYRATSERHNSSSLLYTTLSLGALPLLYPSFALLLPLWIVALLITSTYTYRDIGVVLAGVIVPLTLGIYLKWQFNSDVSFVDEFSQLFRSTIAPKSYAVEWLSPYTLLIVIGAALSFIGLSKIDDMSMRYSMRRLFRTSNIWLLLSLALMATPSFSFEQFSIMAAPAALLLTNSIIFARREVESYLMLALLCAPFVADILLAAVWQM